MRQVNNIVKPATESGSHYRRTVRLQSELLSDAKGGTILYTIRIQVMAMAYWVTIWSESCDLADLDACRYMLRCAEETLDKLTEKI